MCRGANKEREKTDCRFTEPSPFLTPTDLATEKKIEASLHVSVMGRDVGCGHQRKK